jgi:hypothetical protein
VEATEVEGQRCGCLYGDACCLGQIQLLTQSREGGIRIAETVQENEDVGGLL